MPVTEGLMQVGSFTLNLTDPPYGLVRDKLAGFNGVVVTPTRLADTGVSRATLLASARYRGVVFGWSDDKTQITGAGLLSYLADGAGIGPGYRETLPLTARTFEQWFDRWVTLTVTNALTKGSTYSMPATTWPSNTNTQLNYIIGEALGNLAEILGVEYRVNPDGSVDMGATGSALFRTTPQVLLSRWTTGRAGQLVSFPVDQWGVSVDYEDRIWASRAEINAVTATPAGTGGSSVGRPANSQADGVGNVVRATLVQTPNGAAAADFNDIARAALRTGSRTEVRVTVDAYDPGYWMQPGDTVYVFDPINGLVDTANQVDFLGETICPADYRLFEMQWPIQEGMGVYLLRANSQSIVDLSDWVAWEDSATSLSIGARSRSAFDP